MLLRSLLTASLLAYSVGYCTAQPTAAEIPQPRVVRAVDGVLTDTLRLAFTKLPIMGRMVDVRTYNGEIPSSVWRVRQGETLRIHLDNQLPANPDADLPDQGNFPQRANTTNLHVHGLNVSPKGNSDNVLLAIEPGSSFDFAFELPKDHATGTYWYHPHHHTSTYPQIMNGLAGGIVVEDADDPTLTDPALLAVDDRVFIFSSFLVDTTTNSIPYPRRLSKESALAPLPGIETPVYVNGVLDGRLTMRPGEIQRWRMINATYELTMKLTWKKVVGADTVDVAQQHIANDGLYLSKSSETSTVSFTSGARVDVLVQAPADSATHIVVLETMNRDLKVIDSRTMAVVYVDGTPVDPPMSMPASLPVSIPQGTIRDEEITGTRELVFRIGDIGQVAEDSSAIMRTFTIDNAPFNHDVVNITVKAGDVEEWTLRNDSRGYHPFHIHVNEFQLVAVDGVRLDEPIWHDVLLLAPYKTYTIRHRFGAFDGKTVLHCHFLPHEDWGMMQLIDILPPTSSIDEEPWNSIAAFPNPVVGRMQQLQIPLPAFLGEQPVTIAIYSTVGTELQRLETTAAATPVARLDVSDYPAGTYYTRIVSGSRFAMSEMFVLVR